MSAALSPWLGGRRAMLAGSGEAVEFVSAALAARGAASLRHGVGLVDATRIAALFEAADVEGGADVLVHAGTPMPAAPPHATSLEAWRAGHSADIDGRFLFAAEFTRRARARGAPGAILFLMPSPAGGAGRVAALTAHGALDNLVKSLAVEWARDGIRVNAIASRVVEHPGQATPAQRASLGNLACYLLSDYAAYVTGTVMGIDES